MLLVAGFFNFGWLVFTFDNRWRQVRSTFVKSFDGCAVAGSVTQSFGEAIRMATGNFITGSSLGRIHLEQAPGGTREAWISGDAASPILRDHDRLKKVRKSFTISLEKTTQIGGNAGEIQLIRHL